MHRAGIIPVLYIIPAVLYFPFFHALLLKDIIFLYFPGWSFSQDYYFFCFRSSDPVYVFGLLLLVIAYYCLFASWLILIGILYVVLYSLCGKILKHNNTHNTTEKQRHTDNNGKADSDSIQHARETSQTPRTSCTSTGSQQQTAYRAKAQPAPMDSDTAKSRSNTAEPHHGIQPKAEPGYTSLCVFRSPMIRTKAETTRLTA